MQHVQHPSLKAWPASDDVPAAGSGMHGIHAVSDPARRLTLHRGMLAALGALFAGWAATAVAGGREAALFERVAGLVTTACPDGRVVAYWGVDAGSEHLFKFVADGPRLAPGVGGRLLVARFEPGGHGWWLPVDTAAGWPLRAAVGARVPPPAGATPVGRRQWMAVDARRSEVYCPLVSQTAGARRYRDMVKWREAGGLRGERFDWSHFVIHSGPSDMPEPPLWAVSPLFNPDRTFLT